MSTQLLEPGIREDEITGESRAVVAPAIEGVSFDRATRHRLVVAEHVANTLESLSDARSWDRLDPAIQGHLLAHARALEDHVAQLGSQRAVRAVEDAALRLKRLERRLEIAVDHLAPPAGGRKTGGGLFLGDFTEIEIEPGAEGEARKKSPKKQSAQAKARAALGSGLSRLASGARAGKPLSRAERVAAKATSRRITLWITTGAVLTAAALGWNLKETYSQARTLARPPSAGLSMNAHLSDLRVFVPATTTVLRDRDIRIVVANEWLLRSEAQRRVDAEGAHVWLSNRNVIGMMLTWEDGTPLARFENGKGTWYDLANPGRKLGGERPAE